MRHLLVYAILFTTLPISTPARAAAAPPPTHAAAAYPLAAPPAQDPTPSPTPSPTPTPDPVLEQAQREAKLAEEMKKKAVSDKERAEAEAARLKALVQPFGAPANVTVPTGSVTTDAAGWVESQMLAQEAAKQITRRLTQSLCTDPITPGAPPLPTPVPAGAQPGTAHAPPTIKTLVIHSPNDLAGVELYGAIMGQLKNLHVELTKKNNEAKTLLAATDPALPSGSTTAGFAPAVFAAPGIATGVIKSVAELVNLFRTETSFTNQAITLNENTIVSHIVRSFNSGNATGDNCDAAVRVYHPALYAPRLLDSSETSAIINLFNDVETAKVEAAGNVEKLDARIKELKDLGAAFKSRDDKTEELNNKTGERKAKDKELRDCRKAQKPAECRKRVRGEMKTLDDRIAQLDKDIKKLNHDLKDINADPKKFKDWSEQLTDLRAKTQSLVTATNLISAKLNTPDDATRLTALAQLIRAEKIHGILKAPGSYTLHVEVKANGTTKVKKNLFVDAKVRHSAGADLTYQLIEGGGVVAQGDDLKCYIEYQSARNVQDMVSGTGSRRVKCKFPEASDDEDEDEEKEKKRKADARAARRRKATKTDSGQ